MKIPFKLGTVGHFGLAVRDPKKSARWFRNAFGLRKEFEFENGIAIGNDNVTIALFKGKPSPRTLDHMSLHLPNMSLLRKALAHLKSTRSRSKIRATRLVRKGRVRRTWAFGFMISTDTAGNSACRAAAE